jgi:hypothetical protein
VWESGEATAERDNKGREKNEEGKEERERDERGQ